VVPRGHHLAGGDRCALAPSAPVLHLILATAPGQPAGVGGVPGSRASRRVSGRRRPSSDGRRRRLDFGSAVRPPSSAFSPKLQIQVPRKAVAAQGFVQSLHPARVQACAGVRSWGRPSDRDELPEGMMARWWLLLLEKLRVVPLKQGLFSPPIDVGYLPTLTESGVSFAGGRVNFRPAKETGVSFQTESVVTPHVPDLPAHVTVLRSLRGHPAPLRATPRPLSPEGPGLKAPHGGVVEGSGLLGHPGVRRSRTPRN